MRVLTLEEHSSVVPEWWRGKVRNRTLVCLDAHLDLQHVSGERLRDLQQCGSAEAVQLLEKPHHLLPDQHFGYSLENHLYVAFRMGMINRLVWVAPPHVNIGYSREVFDQLQQMDGVLFEELASFRRADEGWIEGKLLGLDITICSDSQLERLALPANSLIDVDTDFFVTVPGDEAWVNPRTVFEVLGKLTLKPELITISRSVRSGFMPLRFRFFADYLAALWEDRCQDAAHFERLFHLDCELRAGNRAAVFGPCERELENHPQCAATAYLLALAASDPVCAREHHRHAANLCSAYRPTMLRSACEIRNRRIPVRDSTVMALERALPELQGRPREQSLARVALGLLYGSRGNVPRAIAHYEQWERHFGPHPELALEIGKRLLPSGQAELARPYLEVALHDDKSRSAAHACLAHLDGLRGSMDQALQHLETAHAMAPAWGQILPMLAETHQQLGHSQQTQAWRRQYHLQQLQVAELAERLSAPTHAP